MRDEFCARKRKISMAGGRGERSGLERKRNFWRSYESKTRRREWRRFEKEFLRITRYVREHDEVYRLSCPGNERGEGYRFVSDEYAA